MKRVRRPSLLLIARLATDATRHDGTVMLGPIGCVADAADRSATIG